MAMEPVRGQSGHAGGRSQDALGVEANGEIAFARGDVVALVHPAARDADVEAVLFLTLRSTRE